MSLLIKGMDMPKNMFMKDYTLRVRQDGTAELIDRAIGKSYDVIDVPSPHGRLIDADELIKQYSVSGEEALEMMAENMEAFRMTYKLAKRIRNQINRASTIIEAEE